MEKIELIKDLQERSTRSVTKTPSNIEYQEYDVTVLSETITVQVPLRESENFEKALTEVSLITKTKLKKMLQHHRGFIQVNKNKHKD